MGKDRKGSAGGEEQTRARIEGGEARNGGAGRGGIPIGLPGTGLEAPTPEGREGVSQEGWLQERLEPGPPLEVPFNLPPSHFSTIKAVRALFPGETAPGWLPSGSAVVLDENRD